MVIHSYRELRAILRELPFIEVTDHKYPEHIGELRKITFVKYYAFYSVIDGKPGHPVSKENFGKGEQTLICDTKSVEFHGDVCSVYKYYSKHAADSLCISFRVLSRDEAAAYKRSRRGAEAVRV